MPDVPQVFESAICAATADALEDALRSLDNPDEPSAFLEVLPVLERVWAFCPRQYV